MGKIPPPRPPGGGGDQRPKKTFAYRELASKFLACNNFQFFFEEKFSDVGGWVGWGCPRPPPLTRRGSVRYGLCRSPYWQRIHSGCPNCPVSSGALSPTPCIPLRSGTGMCAVPPHGRGGTLSAVGKHHAVCLLMYTTTAAWHLADGREDQAAAPGPCSSAAPTLCVHQLLLILHIHRSDDGICPTDCCPLWPLLEGAGCLASTPIPASAQCWEGAPGPKRQAGPARHRNVHVAASMSSVLDRCGVRQHIAIPMARQCPQQRRPGPPLHDSSAPTFPAPMAPPPGWGLLDAPVPWQSLPGPTHNTLTAHGDLGVGIMEGDNLKPHPRIQGPRRLQATAEETPAGQVVLAPNSHSQDRRITP